LHPVDVISDIPNRPTELTDALMDVNVFSGQIEDYLEQWQDIRYPDLYEKLLEFGIRMRETEEKVFGFGIFRPRFGAQYWF
jgi:hypothetical protein